MAKKIPENGTVADPAPEIAGEVAQRPGGAHPGTPVAEPEGGWPPDQYTGIGGSYVRDPLTGLRRPADPAPETPDAAASVE